MAVLHREPERLLLDEVPPAPSLRPILDVIGMGAHRLTEIAGRIGQKATSLAHPLSRLVDMELVRREVPFGQSEKSSKRALYKIADPFMRFWFRVVAPNRALLTHAPRSVRVGLCRKFFSLLRAQAWEDLCRQSVPRLTQKRSPIAQRGPWHPASRFWQAGKPEWDVVSRSLDGKRLLLGEVKWSERPLNDAALGRVAEELIRKGTPKVKGVSDCRAVRCAFVPATAAPRQEVAGVHVVTAEDVVRSLR